MAQCWYNRLPPNSIGSFKELSKVFINQFVSGGVHEMSSTSLMGIQQGRNESLRDYINRFTRQALKVPDLEDKVATIGNKEPLTTSLKGLWQSTPPESILKLQDMARKYIKDEEIMRKYEPNSGGNGNEKKRKETQEYDARDKYPRTTEDSDPAPKKGNPGQRFTDYTRLNAPRSQIPMDTEKDVDL
ncbi:hypothetical protein POM88_050676 [Heracleum sosnowskyi]|uniref:Retrotransposon gag domain-containing protein n=1 Tax=Heracleum sosnowskyi TaxID=360622 RepID=A0AAD8M0M1_9APIA|nr:hypothetical protein POM88_050676 [Heracleum sosnowskyi]